MNSHFHWFWLQRLHSACPGKFFFCATTHVAGDILSERNPIRTSSVRTKALVGSDGSKSVKLVIILYRCPGLCERVKSTGCNLSSGPVGLDERLR